MHQKIRILVGYDGSLQSKKALNEAASIAKDFSGFVKVVTVYGRGAKGKAEANGDEVEQTLKRDSIAHEVDLVEGSDPAKTLEATCKRENFDLVVVGSRGLGKTVSMFLGSVSSHVVANAQCNVLVVKK